MTPHEFSPEESLSLLWSLFTNPCADEAITVSLDGLSSPLLSMYDFAKEDSPRAPANLPLAKMKEGLGCRSGSSSGSPLNLFEGEEEGWYDLFDLTSYTSPIFPWQSWSLRIAGGLEPPPVMYPATILLLDIIDNEDTELAAIVILPRSLAFDPWQ